MSRLAGLIAAWVALPALAAVEGPGVGQLIQATHTTAQIRADGKLDEPAWQQAPVFDTFVQTFPKANAAPSQRTQMRVLYDENNLYFGFHLQDSHPEEIIRKLGRRDQPPYSDAIQVIIDSAHDHRTGYVFKVTAGGVQADSLLFQDNKETLEWDAVWDGAASMAPDGWTAEIVIPLRILRFPSAPVQTWGFAAQRTIARLYEESLSVFIPRDANGRVSRLGHLTGLEQLQNTRRLELTPYVATRMVLRPQFSDATIPDPRLLDPSADLGLDVKAALTSDLTLNATINPDFGQVEADQLILNLSTFEQYLPEKRPFFIQGMDLFQPVLGTDSPHQLFYSRRIGLDAPILGAAKLTGTVGKGLDVGFLDVLVAGAQRNNVDEARPDRTLRFNLMRPLHLGPDHELPATLPVPQNYFMGVVRGAVGPNSTVGGRVSSAIPLTGRCTEAEAALPTPPPSCTAQGGNAAAVDWDLHTADGTWALQGQMEGSQVVGGPPSRTLLDGVVLARGAGGFGGYVTAGKLGGEPFRFDVNYRYASPTLDLNSVGFLRSQNQQIAGLGLHYTRPNGVGMLHRFDVDFTASQSWTTDGRLLPRNGAVNLNVRGVFPGWYTLGTEVGMTLLGYDVREISGTGLGFYRRPELYMAVLWNTDESKSFFVNTFAAIGFNKQMDGSVKLGYGSTVSAIFRPNDWLETRLSVNVDRTVHGPRYVEPGEEGQYFFGELHSEFASLTLRQQWVVTPKLTLQAYAQLFTDFGRYGAFYEARSSGAPIRVDRDLTPSSYVGPPGFHDAALNLNLVLRWEYRLGSTLFLVYSRAQHEGPYPRGVTPPATLLPANLFAGPANDALLLKWSYWWSV
ncbi:carbohydrate binding family 9 domain-containing protein [Archangium gephyra]|nr:carbohydrate binding family 9 domain-containing protein [Archangium gephyra]